MSSHLLKAKSNPFQTKTEGVYHQFNPIEELIKDVFWGKRTLKPEGRTEM